MKKNNFSKILILFFLSFFILSSASENLADDEYFFGPGDIVKIDFLAVRYMTATYTIDNYGEIILPVFGKYKIANKSINFVKNELIKMYSGHLKNPEIEVILVKSYKSEQSEQNRVFLEKLETIKHNYFLRNYESVVSETLKLLDFIVDTTKRDKQVFGGKSLELEILDFDYSLKNGFYEIKGRLRNNVSAKYNWVKCSFKFYSANDKLLTEREHYLVRDVPIYQTQIAPFEFKGVAHKEAVRIKYEITDFRIEE